jgi:hypothetical protein
MNRLHLQGGKVNYYDQIFTLNTTIVLFYFISLHQTLHVSTTSDHPQVLQIFLYNYQTVTFKSVYMWFSLGHMSTLVY